MDETQIFQNLSPSRLPARAQVNTSLGECPICLHHRRPGLYFYGALDSSVFLIPSPLLNTQSVFLLVYIKPLRTGTFSFHFFPPTIAFNALIFVKYQNETLLLLKYCYNKDFRWLLPSIEHLYFLALPLQQIVLGNVRKSYFHVRFF